MTVLCTKNEYQKKGFCSGQDVKSGLQRVPSAERCSGPVLLQISLDVFESIVAADWLLNDKKTSGNIRKYDMGWTNWLRLDLGCGNNRLNAQLTIRS